VTYRCIGLVIVALSLVACPSAAAQGVTITAPPELPSVALVGDSLEATAGEWSPPVPDASYQWLRCNLEGSACVPIDGETTLGYTVVAADEDGTLRIRLTVNAPGDDPPPSAESNPTLVPRPPTKAEDPAVTGTPREGQVLSASRGQWTGTPPLNLALQWKRCNAAGTGCAPISGAASDTYVLTAGDVGTRLLVAVTASNAAGAVTIESALTGVVAPAPFVNIGPPEIVGVALVGASLRATTGRWVPSGPSDFLYRWLRCRADGSDCIPIPGAVGASYQVRPLDVGSRLRVRVTAISDAGSSTQDSALTAVVTAPPLGATEPGQPPPKLMRPFPRVRIKGYLTRSGAVLQLVTVRGPRVARIALSCWGRDCPFRKRTRPLRGRARLRSLERFFRAGTRIVVRVTQPRRIGKHTRIVIRAGRPPARRDRCLMPGSLAPLQCPRRPERQVRPTAAARSDLARSS
jgi:hypothetical protein